MNQYLKTFILGFALIGLLVAAGSFFGPAGMIMGLALGLVGNGVMYWYSDKIVLSMNGGRPLAEEEAPDVFRMTRRLAQKAGLPMPRLYEIPMPTPNAFATGRNPEHAVVAVSPALVQMLSSDELEGVLAHELSHVKHRDILIATMAACVAGIISHLAQMAMWFGLMGGRRDDDEGGNGLEMLGMMIVAPLAATLIQLAISRSREFAADAMAAEITGRPLSLARALKTIHEGPKLAPGSMSPATASLYIANPFSLQGLAKWFSTHPPVEERIARLETLANQQFGIHS